jgi:hypothetical protein
MKSWETRWNGREENFFTRAAGLVRSARRAAESAFSS